MKEYNPQTAKLKVGEHFSEIQTSELSKHYDNYFSLTLKAKRCLATNLGITVQSLRKWMYRKSQKEKDSQRTKHHRETLYEPEQGINVAGTLEFYL